MRRPDTTSLKASSWSPPALRRPPTALLGFGFSFFVEVFFALVAIWQFRSYSPEARERLALRLIAASFSVLAAWVTVDADRALFGAEQADSSAAGIAIAATSVFVMPLPVLGQAAPRPRTRLSDRDKGAGRPSAT
jgi:hypothetical protein